jgi:hypothetical protein
MAKAITPKRNISQEKLGFFIDKITKNGAIQRSH